MPETDSGTAYAVLDPRSGSNREMIAALGTDVVELESPWMGDPVGLPCFRVKLSALGEDRVIAVCRLLARRNGMSLDRALMEAVQGKGISICAAGCYVCRDPEVGREYFAARGAEDA